MEQMIKGQMGQPAACMMEIKKIPRLVKMPRHYGVAQCMAIMAQRWPQRAKSEVHIFCG